MSCIKIDGLSIGALELSIEDARKVSAELFMIFGVPSLPYDPPPEKQPDVVYVPYPSPVIGPDWTSKGPYCCEEPVGKVRSSTDIASLPRMEEGDGFGYVTSFGG